LNNTTSVYHPVVVVKLLVISTVNPVYDVKSAVNSQQKDIVSGKIFYFPVALKYN
jgi:hypothetical protein